jgi:hypothetical protein
MEPPGKEKEGQDTKHLPSRPRERCKEDEPHMDAAGEIRTREKAGENWSAAFVPMRGERQKKNI